MSFYDIKVTESGNNEISLSSYEGKVLLIVNTATGCGFTPQYNGLQDLYLKYQSQGLEILDFPCNQFGGQAPGSEEEIHGFCQLKYGITFKQFVKIDVNGENESPLYTYRKKQKGSFLGSSIKWNFTKFLVDRSGNVVGRYGSADTPAKLTRKSLSFYNGANSLTTKPRPIRYGLFFNLSAPQH